MTAAPDLSGDGLADVAVSSIGNSEVGANAGEAHLVAGPLAPDATTLDLASDAVWLGETAVGYGGVAPGNASQPSVPPSRKPTSVAPDSSSRRAAPSERPPPLPQTVTIR